MSRAAVHTRTGRPTSDVARRVPHCLSCLTLFLASGHSRDRIATNPCERGSRGRPDWPGFAQPDPLFGHGEMRIRSEGGQATGRCYSFLKLALRHGGRPACVGTCGVRLRSGPKGDPCWHVSIAVDAGHPTGECKVPVAPNGTCFFESRPSRGIGWGRLVCLARDAEPELPLTCLCQTSRGPALLWSDAGVCVEHCNNLSKAPSARELWRAGIAIAHN